MSVNIQRNGALLPIAGSGGNPEDIEELRAQIAQMKTKIAEMEEVLEGKAGVNKANTFTKPQILHANGNISNLVIKNEANVPSIAFVEHLETGDNSLDFYMNNDNLYINTGTERCKLLDSRDTPKVGTIEETHDFIKGVDSTKYYRCSPRCLYCVVKVTRSQSFPENSDYILGELNNYNFNITAPLSNSPYIKDIYVYNSKILGKARTNIPGSTTIIYNFYLYY